MYSRNGNGNNVPSKSRSEATKRKHMLIGESCRAKRTKCSVDSAGKFDSKSGITIPSDEYPDSQDETPIENRKKTKIRKKHGSVHTNEHQSESNSHRITNNIMWKVLACWSFYGNYVIMPAVSGALEEIENNEKNVEFNYWYEVLAFINSYVHLSATDELKQRTDKLVNDIDDFVKQEGFSIEQWRTLICMVPDDTYIPLDDRLEEAILKEMEILANNNELGSDLSQPMVILLKSVRQRASQYIIKDQN